MSANFYLTQRLTRRDLGAKGFDGLFGCDYMGAAEFEWGAIPDSLKRIRAARKVVMQGGLVTRKSITVPVFVVGDSGVVASIPDLLTAWMVDDYPRGKEMTYFPEHVEGVASDYMLRTRAWWSLTDDVMWTLDRDIAADLLRAVTS